MMYLVGWTSVRVFKREPFKASLSAKWIVPPMLGIIQMSQTLPINADANENLDDNNEDSQVL